MKKKELIENIKSIPTLIISFILIVSFFSWYSIVYNYTLISFRKLVFISILINILFWILVYFYVKNKPDLRDLVKAISTSLFKDIGFSLIIISLSSYLGILLFLSINYIPIGPLVEKEYRIHDAYTKKGKRKKSHYVKIKKKNEIIELRIFLIQGESLNGKKKIILETQRGLLGFEIIKNRILK